MKEFEGCADMVHSVLSLLRGVAHCLAESNLSTLSIERDATAENDVRSALAAQVVTIVSERQCGVP
jgi:hypothetical protein